MSFAQNLPLFSIVACLLCSVLCWAPFCVPSLAPPSPR